MATTSFPRERAKDAESEPASAQIPSQPIFELQNLTALPANLSPLPEQAGPLSIVSRGDTPRVRLFREQDYFTLEVMGGETPFKMPLDRPPGKNELPLAFAFIQIRPEEGSDSHVNLKRRSGRGFIDVSRKVFGQTDYGLLAGINPSTTQDHVNDALHFVEGIQWGMLIGTAKDGRDLHIQTPGDSSSQASDPGKDTHFATLMLPYAITNSSPKRPPGQTESIEFPYQFGDTTASILDDKPHLKITVTAPRRFGAGILGSRSLELHFDLNQRTALITTPKTGELEPLPLGRDSSLRSAFWHLWGINHGLAATF